MPDSELNKTPVSQQKDPPKIGYLLINLGTPASSSTADVRRYLNEFLMDPYVIDLPWLARRLLVSAFVLPFRPQKSALAYQKIWTPNGSPLLLESQRLVEALAHTLAGPVVLGMRYGTPTIADGLRSLEDAGVEQIIVAPLYPQFADSTISTSLDLIDSLQIKTPVSVLPPFYQEADFIGPLKHSVVEHLPTDWDHLLLSFHGLPEQHLTRADPTNEHCMRHDDCCNQPSPSHATCYRHQVFATAHALADALQIDRSQYTVSFQSRLGRQPWLKPYTDKVLAELPGQGVKHLVVACPAFVADNLETLEEMGIQGRATFLQAGGESFTLVPCLNSSPTWVAGLAKLLANQTAGASSLT